MDDDAGLKKRGFPDQKIGEFQEEQKTTELRIKASVPNFSNVTRTRLLIISWESKI